jgi:hypothetical protein
MKQQFAIDTIQQAEIGILTGAINNYCCILKQRIRFKQLSCITLDISVQ